jgi:hypothetical protein
MEAGMKNRVTAGSGMGVGMGSGGVAVLALLALTACSGTSGNAAETEGADAASAPATADQQAAPNTLTAAEQAEGWRLLFDGRTTNGWRGYRTETVPAGWAAVDGALTRVSESADIVTIGTFKDFEMKFEWKISPGGNSGVLYRAALGLPEIYHGAPEYQILDDTKHPDGQSPLTSAGADYALYPAPRGVVKPVGEWNTGRIVANGNHVEHWLNGQKVADLEMWSDDWKDRVAKSKFAEWPEYGKAVEGHIGLQEHGGWVAYRNIKIRDVR